MGALWAWIGFSPEGIILHGGLVYVAQVATNSILRFKTDGTFFDTFFSGTPLNYPFYFDFDSSGNLYVANLFSFDGSVLGGNVVKITPDGTPSIIADIDRPVGIAICRALTPAEKTLTQTAPYPSGTYVPLNTPVTWTASFVVSNVFSTAISSVVFKDYFSAALAVDTNSIIFSAPAGSGATPPLFATTTGKQPQWRFTWSIGTLQPGQTATLSVNVFTTTNAKGIQHFTKAGLQILNSGANLKWIPPSGIMQSFTTLSVFVMAGNTVGAVAGVVTSAGTAIGGATVTMSSGGTTIGTATTSDIGFYHFDVVAPGAYTVSATTTTGTATATVTVSAGVVTVLDLST